MKFAAAYYLLLIYSTVIFKPLILIVEDAVFHCFAEAYHVATIHAKYGNNHVDVEIANDAKDDTSNKNQNLPKSSETLVHIVTVLFLMLLLTVRHNTKIFYCKDDKLLPVFLYKHIPPPKLS